jgi:hypothetical protein
LVPEALHLRLRPTWGVRYFTNRYVSRRVASLERALSQRIAVGEVDATDKDELAALAAFKASLGARSVKDLDRGRTDGGDPPDAGNRQPAARRFRPALALRPSLARRRSGAEGARRHAQGLIVP